MKKKSHILHSLLFILLISWLVSACASTHSSSCKGMAPHQQDRKTMQVH